jgi:hypothetical protein
MYSYGFCGDWCFMQSAPRMNAASMPGTILRWMNAHPAQCEQDLRDPQANMPCFQFFNVFGRHLANVFSFFHITPKLRTFAYQK